MATDQAYLPTYSIYSFVLNSKIACSRLISTLGGTSLPLIFQSHYLFSPYLFSHYLFSPTTYFNNYLANEQRKETSTFKRNGIFSFFSPLHVNISSKIKTRQTLLKMNNVSKGAEIQNFMLVKYVISFYRMYKRTFLHIYLNPFTQAVFTI